MISRSNSWWDGRLFDALTSLGIADAMVEALNEHGTTFEMRHFSREDA
jgi:hypothetical protein